MKKLKKGRSDAPAVLSIETVKNPTPAKRATVKPDAGPRFAEIEMARILPPENPARAQMGEREMAELIESLQAVGLLEPIIVEQQGSEYHIIAGHRRFLAATQLRWSKIPAIVRPAGSVNKLAVMLHENAFRESVNPAQEALWMAQAREEMALDEEGLCKLFHCSANYVGNRFQLLRGDPKIFDALAVGEIRLGVAHELNRITDEALRLNYLDVARRSDPSQRVVHQWVQDWILHSNPNLPALQTPGAGDAGGNGNGAAASPGAPGVDSGQPPAPGADPSSYGCQLCGGYRDPYNLVIVRIHKHEWDQIQASVERAQRGLETEPQG